MKSNDYKKSVFLFWGIFITLFLIADVTLGYFDFPPMKKRYMKVRVQHPYYHHGLKPFQDVFYEEIAAGYGYPLMTNSLGFKDASTREVPLRVDKKRILFIGDSFTEGIFFPYESTFAGQIAGHRPDLDILNAGATSYSPLIYYLKVDYLLKKAGLKFDELFVFIDISDIQDEYLYMDLEKFRPSQTFSVRHDLCVQTERFLYNHSYAYNLLRQAAERHSRKARIAGERGVWTLDQRFYDQYNLKIKKDRVEQWAGKGIAHALENMQKLADLCRDNNIALTIVVYPWDKQIYAGDTPSRQEIIWRSFAQKNGIGFLDLFPVFINDESPETIFEKYFLPGDLHWNIAGHTLVANKVLDYMEKRK